MSDPERRRLTLWLTLTGVGVVGSACLYWVDRASKPWWMLIPIVMMLVGYGLMLGVVWLVLKHRP